MKAARTLQEQRKGRKSGCLFEFVGAYASLRTGVDGISASGIRRLVPVEEEIYSLRFDFDLGRRTAAHQL